MCFRNSLEKFIERVKPSIGIIGFFSTNNGKTILGIRGTTFCVSSSYFVSAAHVYNQIPDKDKGNLKIWILDSSDEFNYIMCDAKFVTQDIINDCVIIELLKISEGANKDKKQFIKPLAIADSEKVKEGEKLFFSGFPESTMAISSGRKNVSFVNIHAIIATIKKNSNTKKTELFYLDTNCDKGFSGSPVFSQKSSRIIGFISGRFAKPIVGKQQRYEIVGLGIARPINPATQLLKEVLSTPNQRVKN